MFPQDVRNLGDVVQHRLCERSQALCGFSLSLRTCSSHQCNHLKFDQNSLVTVTFLFRFHYVYTVFTTLSPQSNRIKQIQTCRMLDFSNSWTRVQSQILSNFSRPTGCKCYELVKSFLTVWGRKRGARLISPTNLVRKTMKHVRSLKRSFQSWETVKIWRTIHMLASNYIVRSVDLCVVS